MDGLPWREKPRWKIPAVLSPDGGNQGGGVYCWAPMEGFRAMGARGRNLARAAVRGQPWGDGCTSGGWPWKGGTPGSACVDA